MPRLAVSPRVADVSPDTEQVRELGPRVNEAQVQWGARPEEWITLPVTTLTTLKSLRINDMWLLGWQPFADGEALVVQRIARKPGKRKTVYVTDKDRRMVRRRVEHGVTEVYWA